MPLLILAPGARTVQLGLARPFPQVVLPRAQLPLQPALTFATRLLIVCARDFSLTKAQLRDHELVVACPSVGLPFDKRRILRNGADLLHMPIRFFSPYDCVRAVASRDCTVIDIRFNHTIIFDRTRVEAIAVGLAHITQSVMHVIPVAEDAQRVIRSAGVIAKSDHQQLGDVTLESGTLKGEERRKGAHVLFGEDDEQNLACAVARFLRDERDVYSRVEKRWVFCIGEGALPGVAERLQTEFEKCRDRYGLKIKLQAVTSDFEGAIVAWAGAAILATAGANGDDDEDRIC